MSRDDDLGPVRTRAVSTAARGARPDRFLMRTLLDVTHVDLDHVPPKSARMNVETEHVGPFINRQTAKNPGCISKAEPEHPSKLLAATLAVAKRS